MGGYSAGPYSRGKSILRHMAAINPAHSVRKRLQRPHSHGRDYSTMAKRIIHNVCELDYKTRGEEAGKIKQGMNIFYTNT